MIVGGGITGLAAAHALEKAEERRDVDVVDRATRLGGNLQTIRHNGFIIDAGPDSWVAAKPHATRLAREVGLGDELIGTRPDTRRVYVVHQRKLHPIPEGLLLGVPSDLAPFVDSELFGWDAKLRAGLDVLVPPRAWRDEDDESVAAFVSRRLGAELSDRLAGPLLGGMFAGDPGSLSVRACAPELVEAEREHGSLLRAIRALRARHKAQPAVGEATAFVSLKRGVGDLVVNVAHKLRDAEIANTRTVHRIARLAAGDARGRWLVKTSDGAMFADDVVLAVPANAAAPIVRDLDPTLAGALEAIAYSSAASVFLAYRKFDVRHPLDAFGVLVPRSENRPILACTFVSSKWDHRAPSGQILLRVSVGGAGNEHLVDREDDELVRLARGQVLDLLGVDRAPMFARVFRFHAASPEPHVGHLGRVKRILSRAAEHPGLHLGGNGFVGAGIPDMVKQGEDIAARIIAR